MSRTLADISTGVVMRFVTVDSHMDALAYRRGWFDVTDLSPAPQLGWHWTGWELIADPPAPNLAVLQADRAGQLRTSCAAAIVAGYTSSALGSMHTYPSTETDQRNLSDAAAAAGSAASGWTTPLWCEASGTWELTLHTAAQVQQVMADWIAFRSAQQQRLLTLTASVQAATTVDAIVAVAW